MIVGIIKPKGPTSHDIIYQVRRITHVKRVGHAGTLDPAASGVLVVAIGRESTKQLGLITNHDKEYISTIYLGATSSTEDGEGLITPRVIAKEAQPKQEDINNTLQRFIGEILQTPPVYSAIKIEGRKAYDLARKGVPLVLAPRNVVIHSIKLLTYTWPELTIHIHCGKGVYIRSLARDIGAALETGGYMSALERVRVGEYTKEKAMTIQDFETYWKNSDEAHSNTDSHI